MILSLCVFAAIVVFMIIGGTIEYQNKCTLFVDLLLPNLTYFAKLWDAVVPNSRQVTSVTQCYSCEASVTYAGVSFQDGGVGCGVWVESGGGMGCGCVVWQSILSNHFKSFPMVSFCIWRQYNTAPLYIVTTGPRYHGTRLYLIHMYNPPNGKITKLGMWNL